MKTCPTCGSQTEALPMNNCDEVVEKDENKMNSVEHARKAVRDKMRSFAKKHKAEDEVKPKSKAAFSGMAEIMAKRKKDGY